MLLHWGMVSWPLGRQEVPCLCLWLACVTPGKLPQCFICQTEEQSLFSSDSHWENE